MAEREDADPDVWARGAQGREVPEHLFRTVEHLLAEVAALRALKADADEVQRLRQEVRGLRNALETKASAEDVPTSGAFRELELDVQRRLGRGDLRLCLRADADGADLGQKLNQALLEHPALAVLDVRLGPGIHRWNDPVSLPEGLHLKVAGSNYQHCYLSSNPDDDQLRCSVTTIEMTGRPRRVYPDRQEGMPYHEHVVYHRLQVAGNHCHVEFEGITIKGTVGEFQEPVYVPGLIVVYGMFVGIVVRDSRVELGHAAFVNASGWGEKTVAFGHVRFVRSQGWASGRQAALIADRGQGWDGRRVSYSMHDVDFGEVGNPGPEGDGNLICLGWNGVQSQRARL